MRRQRNMSQIKEQDKIRVGDLSETEISNMSDSEFKVTLIKMLARIEEGLQDLHETLHQELEDVKKNQLELLDSLNGNKNRASGINSKQEEVERISHLGDRVMESNQAEQMRGGKNTQNENRPRELSNTVRHNSRMIGIPEGEEQGKGAEDLSEEIKAENFLNLGKEREIQIQEAQRAPNTTNPKRSAPRHKVNKMAKSSDKERILKAARERKAVTYKGNPIQLSVGFSAETMQARREWHDKFQLLKGKNLHPKILYPARLSFRIEGEIEFPRKTKVKSKTSHFPITHDALGLWVPNS